MVILEPTETTLAKILNNGEYEGHHTQTLFNLMDLLRALKYLKTYHRMSHGNINPNNILIDHQGNWKLSNFSEATTIHQNYQQPSSNNQQRFN